jgi:ribose transport system ATP-binding protein
VIGLTGTVRSGLHDLAYVVAGILRPDAGHVQVEKGVRRACVPAHRETEGVFPTETEEFNLTAGLWGRWRSRSGLLSPSRIAADCAEMAEHLALIPRDLHAELSQLSGGNQQKAVLGRALLGRPDLLVLCEPTRGVDVGTRREIYRQVRAAATDGLAVVVASTDLEDLVELADRAAVLEPTGALGPWVTRAQIPSLAAAVV